MTKNSFFKSMSVLVGGLLVLSSAIITTSFFTQVKNNNELKIAKQTAEHQSLRDVDLVNLSGNPWYRNNFKKYDSIPAIDYHITGSVNFLGQTKTVQGLDKNVLSNFKKVMVGSQTSTLRNIFNDLSSFSSFTDLKQYEYDALINNVGVGYHYQSTTSKEISCMQSGKCNPNACYTKPHYIHSQSDGQVTGVNFKNKWYTTNPYLKGQEANNNGNLSLSLNFEDTQELYKISLNENEFSYDKLLSVDERYTFRGFKTNNLGLKVNDEYLKTLFVMSVNLAKANDLISHAGQAEFKNEGFKAIIKGLINGQLVDLNDPLLKDIFELSHEDLGGVEYSLGYMYGLYASGIDVTQYISTQPKTEFGQLADKYELSVNDPYLAYKLSNLFFNKVGGTATNFAGVEFNVSYTLSSNAANSGNMNAQIIFNEENKKFELYTKGVNNKFDVKGLRIIDKESNESANNINISNVKVVNSSDAQNYTYWEPMGAIKFYRVNEFSEFINDEVLTAVNTFEPSKLITIKDDFSKKELINLFGELSEDELETPSLILENEKHYNKLATIGELSNADPIIEIVDEDLENYILTNATNNLFENARFRTIVEEVQINPFDSVSGIGYDIKFKAFNRKGIETNEFQQTPMATNTIARFQTKAMLSKEIKNELIAQELDGFEFDKSLSFEDNVIEQLIDYEIPDLNKAIISTDLAKPDWRANSYEEFIPEKFDPNGLSIGTLIFKDEVRAADWLNLADKKKLNPQTRNTGDQKLRTISFSINNSKLQILPEPEQTLAGEFDWNLIYIILAIAGGALILIFIAFITHRNIKAKKALTDEDDE